MKGRAILLLFLTLHLVFYSGASSWPMFQHDSGHTGCIAVNSSLHLRDIELLWRFKANRSVTSPVVEDINNDGKREVIFGSADGNLYVINYTGKRLWVYKSNTGISSTPAVGDLNLDGKVEIVFVSGDKSVYVLNERGEPLWEHKYYQLSVSSPVTIANIDSSMEREIIIGKYVLNYRGDKINVSERYLNNRGISIVESNTGYVLAMGRRIPGPSTGESYSYSLPAVCDVNNDGKLEIVIWENRASISGVPVCSVRGVEKSGEILYLLNLSGDIIWKYSIPQTTPPAVADLDGDGFFEIIFASRDRNFYILSHEGYRQWSYRLDSFLNTAPAVADLDNDGKLEILIGTENGSIYAFGSDEKFIKTKKINTTSSLANLTNITSTTITTTTSSTTTTSETTTTLMSQTTTIIYKYEYKPYRCDYITPAIIISSAIIFSSIIIGVAIILGIRYKK